MNGKVRNHELQDVSADLKMYRNINMQKRGARARRRWNANLTSWSIESLCKWER
jgi:hypothetical protein